MPDIRPVEIGCAEDYSRIASLFNTVFPKHPASAETMLHFDRTTTVSARARFVIEDEDGALLAHGRYLEAHWTDEPGRFMVDLIVDPDARGQGLGTSLYEHLLAELEPLEPRKLLAWTFEDQCDGVDFLRRRGFEENMRFAYSQIDVRDFDPAPFAGALERVREQGIRIASLAELTHGVDEEPVLRKLHALHTLLARDVPAPEPIVLGDFEHWMRDVTAPNFRPEGCFVALDGEAFIGFSTLFEVLVDPTLKAQGMTGTLRDYRRRGIATALKLHTIDYARNTGAHVIQTDNEENNPMYLLNLALGFRPLPSEIGFERVLEAA